MDNQATIQGGNSNIIIQGVSDSEITLNVDGMSKSIEKKLDTLLSLLQNQKSFQIGEKIFNIGNINNANFEYILGQSNMKNNLPQELANNIIQEGSIWIKSLQRAIEKQNVTVGNNAMAIFQHYGALIEVFLQKMETEVGNKPDLRRLSFMTEVFQSSLRYLCIIQLAQLDKLDISLPLLYDFYSANGESRKKFDYLNCLIQLTNIIEERGNPFMPELCHLVKKLKDSEEDISETTFYLEQNRLRFLNNDIKEDENLAAFLEKYLTALAYWLRNIAFLAKYRLASIKDINLSYRIRSEKNFVHVYGELHGMYNHAVSDERDYATVRVKDLFTFNHSVLLFKGNNIDTCLKSLHEEGNYISLSPFLIDRSVFEDKPTQTPEIYCFDGYDKSKKTFSYFSYRNELTYEQRMEINSNKNLAVKVQNNDMPKLDDLFEQLSDLFEPLKNQVK